MPTWSGGYPQEYGPSDYFVLDNPNVLAQMIMGKGNTMKDIGSYLPVGRYMRVEPHIWAITELIHRARERQNRGRTAGHQTRYQEGNPDYNSQVCRNGVLGEVIIMDCLRRSEAPKEDQCSIQSGMIHRDITNRVHKGAADLTLLGMNIDIKARSIPPRPYRLAANPDLYKCRINRRKHNQLKSNGLDGYIFVVFSNLSRWCFVTGLIDPSQVETWDYCAKPHDPGDNEGNNYYITPVCGIARLPTRHLHNQLCEREPRYDPKVIEHLAFNDAEFGDKLRARFPDVDWSLI